MSAVQVYFMDYPPLSSVAVDTEEMAQLGVYAVFRARAVATTPIVLGQMERRDRIVLILLDGRRTLLDVARLLHRSELDIAQTLVRLLKDGYIDFVGS